MTRAERIVLAVGGIGVLVIMASYGLRRLIERTTETVTAATEPATSTTGSSPWPWLVAVACLLLLRWAFKAGQYHRGYMHARGIRRSHWNAISGRGH